MQTIHVTVAGVSPLLVRRFTDAAAEQATAGSSMASTAADRGTPREQAASGLYLTAEGDPVYPGPNVYSAMIAAGRFQKIGRVQMTTKQTSLVPTGVWVDDVLIPIVSPEPWRVDTRPVRIPATGGRILRHRACFDAWSLSFSLSVEPSVFSAKVVRQLVDDAGAKIGIGDFRPSCKGPFGRFKVTSWKE